VTRKCIHKGCKKGPSYGPIGGAKKSAKYCEIHIPENEKNKFENVVSERCENPDCKKRATYGPIGGNVSSAKFCKIHIPENEKEQYEDVRHAKCLNSEFCHIIVSNPAYKGYCLRCFADKFPLEMVSRNYKTKERLVVQHIDNLLKSDYDYLCVTFDKKVSDGCSKKRPDIAVDCLTHIVIIEVDENGHNSDEYCSCENKRMMQLFIDYGNRPIIFVRFNPDSYVNSKNEKIPSCFKKTKSTGLLQIAKMKMWDERLKVLTERIKFHLDNIPEQEINIEHLYYTGFH